MLFANTSLRLNDIWQLDNALLSRYFEQQRTEESIRKIPISPLLIDSCFDNIHKDFNASETSYSGEGESIIRHNKAVKLYHNHPFKLARENGSFIYYDDHSIFIQKSKESRTPGDIRISFEHFEQVLEATAIALKNHNALELKLLTDETYIKEINGMIGFLEKGVLDKEEIV